MRCDDMLATDLAAMDRALQEFRNACYDQVSRGAFEAGLLGAPEPFTAEEFLATHALHERAEAAELFLAAMLHWNALRLDDRGRYVSADRTPAFEPDRALLRAAIGCDELVRYPDFDNFAGLARELLHGDGATGAGFSEANLPLWELALQAPYYRYSRLRAARRLARSGPHLLDLACGLGHGLLELADALAADPQTRLVGVDVSPDFARLAANRTADQPHISILCADLDRPLLGLPAAGFDGAMIVGGYHFLTEPDQLWRTAARLIKPGGTLVLAHVLSETGSPDQDLMHLRFALRRPPGHPATRAGILAAAQRHHFRLQDEFSLGCYRTLEFIHIRDRPNDPRAKRFSHPRAEVEIVPVGPLRTNACLLRCRGTGAQLLIDAAAEPDRLRAALGGRLDILVTTHSDWDHIGAASELVTATGCHHLAHPGDLPDLEVGTRPVEHGDIVSFGACRLEVIHVGGHTPGSIVLALEAAADRPAILFTGDALFPGGVGTTWGDTANFHTLLDAVEQRLFARFPDPTVIVPGHGPTTTLGRQRPHLTEWRRRGW
ncbi:MBL fold metallo-hydrolase [Nocardia sp. NPDC127579]|uniref:MBL fold metallo-hydrolase n=1 Tax=Nocardia sp. NPDC127579 TaxID=3345402 RepID=UPI0036365AA7